MNASSSENCSAAFGLGVVTLLAVSVIIFRRSKCRGGWPEMCYQSATPETVAAFSATRPRRPATVRYFE
jgi:hypothetical protein